MVFLLKYCINIYQIEPKQSLPHRFDAMKSTCEFIAMWNLVLFSTSNTVQICSIQCIYMCVFILIHSFDIFEMISSMTFPLLHVRSLALSLSHSLLLFFLSLNAENWQQIYNLSIWHIEIREIDSEISLEYIRRLYFPFFKWCSLFILLVYKCYRMCQHLCCTIK